MKLDVTWNTFFVVIGLIAGLVTSVPMDMDSIKEGIQMGALAGVGMAMDLAEKAHVQGSFDEKISMGPIKMEKKFDAGGGIMSHDDDDDDDDDRKRRRRSVVNDDEKKLADDGIFREKRSPCFGKRRAQQTTTVATPGAGGAGGGAEGGAEGGAGTDNQDGNPDDLRRRRKRSPDYQNDYNENIIPDQNAERTQEIGEKFREIMKGMIDALVGTFDKLRMHIQNGFNNNSPDNMQ